ncbi:transglutaminase family protein [Candidatus Saccharibacteria bacterium]|nr:transglutaminase family protein [Candidatus Saccharibacteria bacterium]
MFYTLRHVTRFRYSISISQSVMEVRMQPRTEGGQRCLSFNVAVTPNARVLNYRDFMGNTVHHFDIPARHRLLSIVTQAQVEVRSSTEVPDSLPGTSWDALHNTEYDMLLPSRFTESTPLLEKLVTELDVRRRDDPLTLLRELNQRIYEAFDYVPDSTHVHSPIDHALSTRGGVCQDFTHIMLALLRPLGIPARYVSGYLYAHNGGTRSSSGASHAWVEAELPDLGWVGFDPTNNLIAGERHIRVAIGRDYADVPPTRGVFKGSAETELSVSVRVTRADQPPTEDPPLPEHWATAVENEQPTPEEIFEHQQQQQQ